MQVNVQATPEFNASISELIQLRKFRSKSDAIRTAVIEAAAQARTQQHKVSFDDWLGLGLNAPLNPNPQFKTDGDIWKNNL